MEVGIAGAGAIGCLLACLFSRHGMRVVLYDRNEAKAARLTKSGLRLEQGRLESYEVRAVSSPDSLAGLPLLILATKAYDVEQALERLGPALRHRPCLVLVQNGIGSQEAAGRYHPRERLVVASLYLGAQLKQEGHVIHAGGDSVELAAMSAEGGEALDAAREAFEGAGLRVRVREDWLAMLWDKLIVNSAINPLTALTGLTNGALLERPELRRLLVDVASESYSVALSDGIRPSYSDCGARVLEACRLTAPNRSSMLQDLEAGRRTEVDYINGYVIRRAMLRGAAAPLNSALYALVKGAEGARGVRG
jgi:2-dehydropantoate 2-reductase